MYQVSASQFRSVGCRPTGCRRILLKLDSSTLQLSNTAKRVEALAPQVVPANLDRRQFLLFRSHRICISYRCTAYRCGAIATDVWCGLSLGLSVCPSVTQMYPTKTTGPIEMPFGQEYSDMYRSTVNDAQLYDMFPRK